MAEPVAPPIPKEYAGLGPLISFGHKETHPITGKPVITPGTTLYLANVDQELKDKLKDKTFDGKKLKSFSLWDTSGYKNTGLDSAVVHMYAQGTEKTPEKPLTVLRTNPETNEKLPERVMAGVRLVDDKGDFIDIPKKYLTTEKPQPVQRKKTVAPTTPSGEAHKILVGIANAAEQDNISIADDGVTEGLIQQGLHPTKNLDQPTEVAQDNVSVADDGVTEGIIPPGTSETPVATTEQGAPSPVIPEVAPAPVAAETPTPPPSTETPTPDVTPLVAPIVEPPPPPTTIEPPTAPVPTVEKRTVLDVVGIQGATERRATDLAKDAMEKSRDIIKRFFQERFEEKYYQHFHKMLEAAQTPFARESIDIAQQRAQSRYDAEMNQRNGLARAARKTWDFIKDHTFGATTLQRYAIEEIHTMQQNGEIQERVVFESEKQAFAKRFEVPFEAADTAIRKTLGERLEILDQTNAEHAPLIDGIKGLVREFRDGTINDTETLNQRLNTLYEQTISPARRDLFGEAETYASSLTAVAKEMKDRLSHGESLATLDAELDAMQVRLGIGQMGEATEITPTATRKWVERINKVVQSLEKRGIINNLVVNEFTLGSAISAVISLKTIPQMAASATARAWIGGGAGAVVTGAVAGRREYGRRQGELRRIAAQKETGIQTDPAANRRQWYETFNFRLRTTNELIDGMQASIFDPATGELKKTLTEQDLRTSLANLADAKARSAVSAREHNRFGLIVVGAVGEQETNRTALANAMVKTEQALTSYIDTHKTEPHVATIVGPTADAKTYIDTLTTTQTQILTDGNTVLNNLSDPLIKTALDPLSSYTPEVEVMRRTLGIIGTSQSKGTRTGVDTILKEFKTQAGVESARVGIRTGAIGLAMGALSNEVVMDIKNHGLGNGAISGLFMHPQEAAGTVPILPTHTEMVGTEQIVLGDNIHIDATGNLDITDGQGHIMQDAIPDFKSHYTNGVLDEFAKNKLHELGLSSSLTSQEVVHTVAGPVTETPGITNHFVGGETFTDAQNITHTSEWTLPEGSHLDAVAGSDHTFNLVNAHGTVIADNIHTDATGAITNFSEIQEKLPEGWQVLDSTTSIQHTPEVIIDPSTRAVHTYTEWDNRGDWGWTEQHIAGESIEHVNPAVNSIKNIWLSWQREFMPNGENVTFDNTIPGLEHVQRSVPFQNGEIWPNAMPNNSIIELPNSLFSDANMGQLAHWSDEAIKMYDTMVASHPEMNSLQILEQITNEDKLHGLMLRIGRFAVPELKQNILSKAELEFLMRELAGGHTEEATTLLHNITFTESVSEPITETVQEHILHVTQHIATESPEGFIPILPSSVRKGLEPATPTKPTIPTVTPPIQTPYGYGYGYGYGSGRIILPPGSAISVEERVEQSVPILLPQAFAVWNTDKDTQNTVEQLTPPEQLHWLEEEASKHASASETASEQQQEEASQEDSISPKDNTAPQDILTTLAEQLHVELPEITQEANPVAKETAESVHETTVENLLAHIKDEANSPIVPEGKADAILEAERFIKLSDIEHAEETGGLTKGQALSLYQDMLQYLATHQIDELMEDTTMDPESAMTSIKEFAKSTFWSANPDEIEVQQRTNILAHLMKTFGANYHLYNPTSQDSTTANLAVIYAAYDGMKGFKFKTA